MQWANRLKLPPFRAHIYDYNVNIVIYGKLRVLFSFPQRTTRALHRTGKEMKEGKKTKCTHLEDAWESLTPSGKTVQLRSVQATTLSAMFNFFSMSINKDQVFYVRGKTAGPWHRMHSIRARQITQYAHTLAHAYPRSHDTMHRRDARNGIQPNEKKKDS